MWKQTTSGVWVPERHLPKEPSLPQRPHWITIILGLLSPLVGVAAVYISLSSLKTAERALDNSQQTLKVGQRAYLSVAEVRYSGSEFQIHLKNSGNTPAEIRPLGLRLVAMDQAEFLELLNQSFVGPPRFSEVMRLSKLLRVLSMRKDVEGKGDEWLKVGCDRRQLSDWNSLPDKIVVAALLQYRDVFDEPHVIQWGWTMDKQQVTTELNDMEVELLLAPHFPKEVTVTAAESIQDLGDLQSAAHK